MVEQAITAMFDPVPGFSVGHLGLFWNRIRSEFPQCIGQPAIQNVIESFGRPEPISVELIQGAPPTRALLQSVSSGELVQVQSDRFSFNWKLTPDSEYPRYEATLRKFWSLFDLFSEFLREEGLSATHLTQCELTNVNIIPVDEFGGTFADATEALALELPSLQEYSDLKLENAQVAAQYVMVGQGGTTVGRLHASAQTVYNIATTKAAIRLDLTARGGGSSLDRRSAQQFFDLARDAINAAFLSYTSAQAHKHWGRK